MIIPPRPERATSIFTLQVYVSLKGGKQILNYLYKEYKQKGKNSPP